MAIAIPPRECESQFKEKERAMKAVVDGEVLTAKEVCAFCKSTPPRFTS
jgi:hypothetical protein